MIGGLEKPDSGEICIDGTELTSLKNKTDFYKETVGFLFQNFALLENKTVRQNLSMIKKDTRTDCSIEQAIRSVGLEKELDKKVYKLTYVVYNSEFAKSSSSANFSGSRDAPPTRAPSTSSIDRIS